MFAYRLVPHSRRARVILIGDEILVKVGGYMLGNVLTSVIAGLGTYFWMLAFGIPYPVLLGLLVTIGYRLAEDYLIVPRVMGRTVKVPAIVSMIAVLVGGVLLGIVGALIAIPVAAAIRLLLHEITFRRLDKVRSQH